jgi:outer membrane receptor protein involved in Fe transport
VTATGRKAHGIFAALAAATLFLCQPIAAQEPNVLVGRPIVDLIAELRQQGVVVIYSSELLRDTLRVEQEPPAGVALDRLRATLEAHGLTLEPGPQGSWLVVALEPPADSDPPAPVTAARAPIAVTAPTIEEVVVSASRYSLARVSGAATSQIDRVQLENTPSLGEDALRATHSLPGLTSSGVTAEVNVRGGTTGEAQLILDGIELFNPFHLKDFQSLFSSIDPNIIDSMTVYTGAFPAEYGNRMSAVISMQTLAPSGPPQIEVGVSLLTTSVATSGTFAGGRGSWLSSLRRGNLDLLIEAGNPDLGSPGYLDGYGSIRFDVDERWSISTGVLALKDEISLNESSIAHAAANYEDTYVWARADYTGPKLSGRYLVSATGLSGDRKGEIADPVTSTGSLLDERDFDSRALKADWTLRLGENQLLSFGAELRHSTADYRYLAAVTESLPIAIAPPLLAPPSNLDEDVQLKGNRRSAYASYRARLLPRMTSELGLRWDAQDYLDDSQLSPRLNVLFELSPRLQLRTSWGRYFQTQRLDELQVNNGLAEFLPAQDSEHYVIGLDYLFDNGIAVRLEAYRKEIEQLQPRSENLFARVSLLPELLPDRVTIAPRSSEATGLELSADGEFDRWRWWGSLTRARTYDEFDDRRVARSWQEPWSLKGGAIRSGEVWTFALTTSWHPGWPISSLSLENGGLVAGSINDRAFGEFSSVDLKFSRTVTLDRSVLQWYVSVLNVFDRKNPCCIDYDLTVDGSGQPTALSLSTDHWLALVPNVGFLWRFSPHHP